MTYLQNENFKTARRLFRENFSNHLPAYLFAIIFMLLAAASTAATAWLMRDIINDIFVSQDISLIGSFAAIIIAISATRGVSTYLYTVALSRIGNAVTASIQQQIIGKLMSMRLDYLSKNHTGQFVARISQNARAAQTVVVTVSTTLGRDLMTVIFLVGVMFVQDPVMSLIAFSVAPPALIGISRIVRKLKNISSEEYGAMGAVVATTQEALLGIKVVKSFGLEKEMEHRVKNAVEQLEARANTVIKIQASTSPLMETLGGISVGLIVLYAGWQTSVMGKSPGEFMAFVAAFLLAYEPAKRLARLHINLQRPLKGVNMLYDLLDAKQIERYGLEKKHSGNLQLKGHVEFHDVRFGYKKSNPILNELSFEALPGTTTAIIGESGAGKTTIFALLQRFYHPWSGEIRIDGKSIREISLRDLRQAISYVGQDTFLFSGTVAQNIRLGRAEATDEEVIAAADAAYATHFIDELPNGFHTLISENGSNFSGGQRQRISIARALLKNAPILLLDEATSALDNKAEAIVRHATRNLMNGRTTLLIAHRSSSYSHADAIYEVSEGKAFSVARTE